MDDDILEQYRLEAAAAMEVEAKRRIAESTDVENDEILRNTSLSDVEDLVPALLARLGQVRAALDGHGGGIKVTSSEVEDDGFNLVLDLTGACLSCGAAPGTLQGVKTDLEKDDEIAKVSFCSSLLDTFDDLGREFILAHGQVDFV
ncbi:MAG: NifU family protein [Candidatus Poseidoniaceae archaeon]|nr:NifU family protein [Candidatus Poseidoniaceae archaeon]|tara:strand:+ start:1113 stop:1550 length:438 start_codon:yes stop_codon:yes gene_type:complete